MPTSRGNSRRTSGSPPVSLRSVTPMGAMTETRRSISSKLSTSARSSQGRPSAGMQYWQRKLQRSVTETLRSEMCRPWPSTSGSTPMGRRVLAVDVPLTEIRAPTRGNRKLQALFEAANSDRRLHAWWYMQQVNADRRDMSDHSWVHVQIVANIALRLFRLLNRAGVEPAMGADHGMKARDAEVVIAAACLFHDTGMSIHRTDHEQYSLFLAADRLPGLLEGVYDEPELTVVISEALHAVIGHRRRGDPITMESGIVRVADALDMASGRSRVPFETRRPNIHSLSAAAIDDVKIEPGDERAVRIEIEMNNSAGLFQVDELLATKLRGSGIEELIEVVAEIDAEHEKRLVPVFRI